MSLTINALRLAIDIREGTLRRAKQPDHYTDKQWRHFIAEVTSELQRCRKELARAMEREQVPA